MSNQKTYTVTTPNPHFTGVREGVQFSKGKGQATKEQAANLVNIWGYACEEDEARSEKEEVKSKKQEDAEAQGVERIASSSTNEELKDFMDANGIDYGSDDIKEDLNAKIDRWVKQKREEKSEKEEARMEK